MSACCPGRRIRGVHSAAKLTCPDIGVLAEERRKVLPFGGIAIYWPALAKLRHGKAVQKVGLATAYVRVDFVLRISRGCHDWCWALIDIEIVEGVFGRGMGGEERNKNWNLQHRARSFI